VAASATEDDVGRAGWIFLDRPDGWSDELDLLVAVEQERSERDRSEADERSARHRAEHLERSVEDLRSRLSAAAAEADAARRALDAERSRRRELERDVEAHRRRAEAAVAERGRATEELAEARRIADERLSRERSARELLRRLEAERDRWVAPVDQALVDARAALAELAAALDVAGTALHRGAADGVENDAESTAPTRSGRAGSSGRARRTPVRLARGAIDGTAEATGQLLRTPGVAVVVDGYNVSMSAWPRLDARTQRDHLVKLLGAASARTGADVHVVFDGDSATEAERRPSVSAPLAVRVHYSAADVEADDVVIAMARDLPADRPVVVVSSDRRVAEGARRHGANVVSSSALLAWVRA